MFQKATFEHIEQDLEVNETLIEAFRNTDYSVLKSKELGKAVEIYKNFGGNYNPVEITTIHQAKGTRCYPFLPPG